MSRPNASPPRRSQPAQENRQSGEGASRGSRPARGPSWTEASVQPRVQPQLTLSGTPLEAPKTSPLGVRLSDCCTCAFCITRRNTLYVCPGHCWTEFRCALDETQIKFSKNRFLSKSGIFLVRDVDNNVYILMPLPFSEVQSEAWIMFHSSDPAFGRISRGGPLKDPLLKILWLIPISHR